MKIPNLFIIGAPRCGTTALNSYLNKHPDVLMSTRKESHYFATDLNAKHFIKTKDNYFSLFKNSKKK